MKEEKASTSTITSTSTVKVSGFPPGQYRLNALARTITPSMILKLTR